MIPPICLHFLCLLSLAFASLPLLPSSCSGKQNNEPLVIANATNLKPLRSVQNGSLFSVLPSGSQTPVLVLHVYGSSYSMGYAYGQLLQPELVLAISATWQYFTTTYNLTIEEIDIALEITYLATQPFTPAHHYDFLHGVADGTGGAVSYDDVLRLALIPELIKAQCSIVGAWNKATASGGLLQLRALDWTTDGPFQQWPLLTTFHPDDGSFTHTTFGFVGLYGTITGWSANNIAISEKIWDAYEGIQNIRGYPWTLMLQDILRFDHDVDEAIARISGANRTCSIWIGLGQGNRPNPRSSLASPLPPAFKLLASAFHEFHIYNPENFPTYPPYHDYFEDLVFVDKHIQPSLDACLNDLMHWGYGAFTAEAFFRVVTALAQPGDMHIAVFDFDRKDLYIACASPPPFVPAYDNGFIQFNVSSLWSQPHPGHSKQHGHLG